MKSKYVASDAFENDGDGAVVRVLDDYGAGDNRRRLRRMKTKEQMDAATAVRNLQTPNWLFCMT